jgi:hypothetical protein
VSRPHSGPRLAAIDGAALGEEAHQRCQEYVTQLCVRVGAVHGTMGTGLLDDGSTLRHAVRTLTGYAQGLHGLDAPVAEYLQTIGEALWIRPIDGPVYQTPEIDATMRGDLDELQDDLAGRLCVVMVAATGREAIEHGKRVTVAQLAALLGYTSRYVTMLAVEGRIRLSGDPLTCSATEAKRVLAERSPQ